MAEPRWKEDFPTDWEKDHYVTRRELAKFLTLGSGLIALATLALGGLGRLLRRPAGGRAHIARASAVPVGGSLLFRYPTPEDPCILLHTPRGFQAYSQVCTHLSCAVVYRPEERTLFCPCHRGYFAPGDGRPTAGPPTRPLPRIRLAQVGDELFALGREG